MKTLAAAPNAEQIAREDKAYEAVRLERAAVAYAAEKVDALKRPAAPFVAVRDLMDLQAAQAAKRDADAVAKRLTERAAATIAAAGTTSVKIGRRYELKATYKEWAKDNAAAAVAVADLAHDVLQELAENETSWRGMTESEIIDEILRTLQPLRDAAAREEWKKGGTGRRMSFEVRQQR